MNANRKHSLPGIALLLLVASPAWAADWRGPERTERGGLTTLVFRGSTPGAKGARLRRADDAGATLDLHFESGSQGASATLRTPRLLLDDDYVLDVLGSAGKVLASLPVRLGQTDADRAAARDLLARWYRDATTDLRRLSADLEAQGAFDLARLRAKQEGAVRLRAEFVGFLHVWKAKLRRLRMNHSAYQRRLLLPHDRLRGQVLIALPSLLLERAIRWRDALNAGEAPGPNTQVEAQVRKLTHDTERLTRWGAGPWSALPQTPHVGEVFVSPLGFRLSVPAQAVLDVPSTPAVRLSFSCEGVAVRIEARRNPRPEDASLDEGSRRSLLEINAWERHEAYRQLSSKPLADGGLRIEFSARFRDPSRGWVRVRVIKRSLYVPESGRIVSLVLILPEGQPLPPLLSTVEESFEVGP